MTDSLANGTAIEHAIIALRQQLEGTIVGANPPLRLGDHPSLIGPLLNRATLLLIKTPELHQLSADTLSFALAPIGELIRDAISGEIQHFSTRGQTIRTEQAITNILPQLNSMLSKDHPFVTHNVIPRALFRQATSSDGSLDYLVELGGYFLEHHEVLFQGLEGSEVRAKSLVALIDAMEKSHDDRNPYPDLPDETKLVVLQRALTVASSPHISSDRMKDFLRPYGSLMHRLIGQSQHGARHYSLPQASRFERQTTPADQAVQLFMADIRALPHYTLGVGEEMQQHTIGSDFSAACERLESGLRLVLDHPDLGRFNAQTLYRALDPIYETFRDHMESARRATQNPQVEAGKSPFLLSKMVDAFVSHIESRFLSPREFFASTGIVLHAQLFHDLTNHHYKLTHSLEVALNNVINYCDENQDALFAKRDGQLPPETDHKLGLLSELQLSLTFPQSSTNAALENVPSEIRGRLFIAAIEKALTSADPARDWKTELSDQHPSLLELAGRSKVLGRPPLNPHENEKDWSPIMDNPKAPNFKLLAGPTASGERVVPITGPKTPMGKEKFENRIARQNGKRPEGEGPSQEDLAGAGDNIKSFADRAKAKREKDASTTR